MCDGFLDELFFRISLIWGDFSEDWCFFGMSQDVVRFPDDYI